MEAAAIQTGDIESPLSFGAGSSCQHVWFRNTKLISSSNGTCLLYTSDAADDRYVV